MSFKKKIHIRLHLVLPLPGPATRSKGEPLCSTAWFCAWFNSIYGSPDFFGFLQSLHQDWGLDIPFIILKPKYEFC